MTVDTIDNIAGTPSNAPMYFSRNPMDGLFNSQSPGDRLVLDPLTGEQILIAVVIAASFFSGEDIFAILSWPGFNPYVSRFIFIPNNLENPYKINNFYKQLWRSRHSKRHRIPPKIDFVQQAKILFSNHSFSEQKHRGAAGDKSSQNWLYRTVICSGTKPTEDEPTNEGKEDCETERRNQGSMHIEQISYQEGRDFVAQHHYAKKSPSTVKFSHGVFLNGELIGVLLWGFGTRPLHTIKKIFPSLGTADYLELCRFCVHDKMPPNTETQILRLSREKIIREHPSIKVLFSWADGMRGRPGFVYQADNWLYGGFIVSEFYRDRAGEVVHPRLLITRFGQRDKAFAKKMGFTKYRGPQFRYIRFVCGHKERKRLLRESPFLWGQPYPKRCDLFLNAEEGSRGSRTATNGQGSGQFRDSAIRGQNNSGGVGHRSMAEPNPSQARPKRQTMVSSLGPKSRASAGPSEDPEAILNTAAGPAKGSPACLSGNASPWQRVPTTISMSSTNKPPAELASRRREVMGSTGEDRPEKARQARRKAGRPTVPIDRRILKAVIKLDRKGHPWPHVRDLLEPISRKYGGPSPLHVEQVRRLALKAAKILGVKLIKRRDGRPWRYYRQVKKAGGGS